MKNTKKILILFIALVAICNCYSQGTLSKSNDKNILVGCWWMPHCAFIQIHFKTNGNFIFHDTESDGKSVILKGKYYLNAGVISLSYNDRPAQKFYLFYYVTNGEKSYEIYNYNKTYIFVKDVSTSKGDCNW